LRAGHLHSGFCGQAFEKMRIYAKISHDYLHGSDKSTTFAAEENAYLRKNFT
jgi:hypothetical protein